jgi:hypothetical protein
MDTESDKLVIKIERGTSSLRCALLCNYFQPGRGRVSEEIISLGSISYSAIKQLTARCRFWYRVLLELEWVPAREREGLLVKISKAVPRPSDDELRSYGHPYPIFLHRFKVRGFERK